MLLSHTMILRRGICTTKKALAGHSKWANIKHDKAKNDLEKNRISFRMSQQITVAVKMGGADVVGNPALATALEKAKVQNVTKKVIENAIKRGTGELGDKNNVEQCTYEGIAPGGVSVIVQALTDNKSRTVGLVKACFTKFGSNLTPTAYLFEKKGSIVIDKGEDSIDHVFEKCVDLGAQDIIEDEENDRLVEVVTDPQDTGRLAKELKSMYKIDQVSIGYKPNEDTLVEITNEDHQKSYDKFVKLLDDVDDVTDYFTNLKKKQS
ncbi:uncharacterized protein PAS_chr4_0673 [Komagataella phaffii GS115]|uniref:Transcriptional regulatory protein n=2 Tax=Komagataella phaffii TaxID=460519 RepID=C4R8K7_KOMPG|nr:uncharacterized protein PAS_chr4_0673 [Komagataella phaffii GS115]AOA65055.1 GQ67_05049T0 [Komagataella phaffii]AOA70238.1 GQ68_05030T0 [Komagataella phaffii GS115]CAY71932.1 Putative protein of unknown function [Komagataella phaffii GS115]